VKASTSQEDFTGTNVSTLHWFAINVSCRHDYIIIPNLIASEISTQLTMMLKKKAMSCFSLLLYSPCPPVFSHCLSFPTVKYLNFLRKRCNVNPRRGEFHYRAPSRIFMRTVRGMLPHKTSRGKAALARLQAFEGVPPKFARQKLLVVPNALRVVRLDPKRKFCSLGRLSHEVGWKYQTVIETLELRRKAQSSLHHSKKKRDAKILAKAKQEVVKKPKIAALAKVLESYGYSV